MAALPQGRILDEAAVETIDGLPKDTPLVFICHKGGRSRQAAESFRRRGYTDVSNVEGGIDAWAREIDPSMARY
jgi:monothiol glutaredoxin